MYNFYPDCADDVTEVGEEKNILLKVYNYKVNDKVRI